MVFENLQRPLEEFLDLSRGAMGCEELLVGVRGGAFLRGGRIETTRSEEGIEEVRRQCTIRGIDLALREGRSGDDRFMPDE